MTNYWKCQKQNCTTCAEVSSSPLERDPLGIAQHAPGAKLDAGKLRPHLVLGGFHLAIEEMVKCGTFGASKYSDYGWKSVPNGIERYLDAHGRHLLKHLKGEEYDLESKIHHMGAALWNLAAALQLLLEAKERKNIEEKFDSWCADNYTCS